MRLIDADALIDKLCENCGTANLEECKTDPVCATRIWLSEAPTVDTVHVVHGEWLSAYEYGLKLGITDAEALEGLKKDKWWKFCEDCGEGVKGNHNYCPNCGAKMDGGAEDGKND